MTSGNCVDRFCLPQHQDSHPQLKIAEGPVNIQAVNIQAAGILQECHTICQKALEFASPAEAGINLSPAHLKYLHACSEVCEFTARMLLQGKAGTELLYGIAARVCNQCADSCSEMEEPLMRSIAEFCRKAAGICLRECHVTNKQAA